MSFTVLFLLLVVTAGWWLHSRWSAVRDAQAARREAEMMIVFEARSKMQDKPPAASAEPSDFYPTLPESAAPAPRSVTPRATPARRASAD